MTDHTPSKSTEAASDGVAGAISALALEMKADREDARDERRRLRRRGWLRWGFFGVLILLVIFSNVAKLAKNTGSYIARVTVSGTITEDPARTKLLADLAKSKRVKAVIVRLESPGGTTVGGETLYAMLRKIAEKKPVVAVMGEVAASAAYMTAIGADRIFARGNTITASVGVILTAPNFHEALKSVGVTVIEVKSGVNKAEPSPFKPVDRENLEREKALIGEIFDWFLDLVKERRKLSPETVALIRDGRIVTGRTALKLGLVDEIGGEAEAVAWLVKEKDLSDKLKIRDRKPPKKDGGLLGGLADAAIDRVLGKSEVLRRVEVGLRGRVPVSMLQ